MSSREIGDNRPAVDESVLEEFLHKVVVYIRDNHSTVESQNKKPFLYTPCQLRVAGECPDQSCKLPDCHICLNAKASADILRHLSPPLDFTADNPREYPGCGTLSMNIRHPKSGGFMTFEVNGDEQAVSIFVHHP